MFVDGNRNGVRALDIAAGLDTPLDGADELAAQFPGVRIDVVAPGEFLTFTPVGTATPATVYVTGKDGSRFAIRVLGATARTRVLRYDSGRRIWIDD